jgi:hypothetical protein
VGRRGAAPPPRGAGASNVRQKINALGRLSESLRTRTDRGLLPAALGRPDVENFLNRLAYLESAGKLTRYRRNVICRGTRSALTGIRALGLTRPGQAAAGLPDVFAVGVGDIPAEPVRGEPGRDLPAEIMGVLCAPPNLPPRYSRPLNCWSWPRGVTSLAWRGPMALPAVAAGRGAFRGVR